MIKRYLKNILLDTAKLELLEKADVLFINFKHSLSYVYGSTPHGYELIN